MTTVSLKLIPGCYCASLLPHPVVIAIQSTCAPPVKEIKEWRVSIKWALTYVFIPQRLGIDLKYIRVLLSPPLCYLESRAKWRRRAIDVRM